MKRCDKEIQHVVRNAVLDIKRQLKLIDDVMNNSKSLKWKTTEEKITRLAVLLDVEPEYALAIAEVESAMGKHQKSPTGAKGVFQMTTVAMKDLLNAMEDHDDDLIDICCGLCFLRLLKRRWGSIQEAIPHYCDKKDRHFYVPKVMQIAQRRKNETADS